MVLSISLLAACSTAEVQKDIKEDDCYPRPHSKDALCYSVTDSDISPYVDYITYLQVNGIRNIQSKQTYQIAVPAGVLYSDNGNYMAISFTEEGHANFQFYDAQSFFHSNQAIGLGFLDEYELDFIESISNDGILRYRIYNEDCGVQTEDKCQREIKLEENKQ